MKNVTYYFGAGASANCLPCVKQMMHRMAKQIAFLSNMPTKLAADIEAGIDQHNRLSKAAYIEDLQWLIDASSKHASVDTFAKKLFIKNKTRELVRLKNCLSAFLLIEQVNKPTDPRYDSFFAAILNNQFLFPKNIKIISWNYDVQFELAYNEFSDKDSIYDNQNLLNVYNKNSDHNEANESFGLYKINGSSTFYQDDPSRNPLGYFDKIIDDKQLCIRQIVTKYIDFKNFDRKYIHGLSFAWESEKTVMGRPNIIEASQLATAKTNILVIIGYSFPFFNREIDRKLINNMKDLEKVYFQSDQSAIIKERFSSIRNDLKHDLLVGINDTEQFYFPNEL